ncbi:hypothetical protein GW7_21032, partial [Heterocephalus glaber]
TSNDCFSTTEESESCVAQPKPCTAGRDSAFYGHSQRGGLPPSEKPKASVMPTANGLAKGVAPTKAAGDQSGPTEKSLPPGGREGAEPRQPGGKGDTSGTEEIKKDVETALEVQSLKGNADMEPSGTAAPGQPLRTAGAGGAGERTEHPQAQTVGLMKPLGTAGELQSQAAMGEDEQCQLPETTPKENRSPEISEGNQLVETVEEQQLQEAVGKDEQAQSQLETIPKENEGPEILEGKIQDKSQPVPTPVMDDPIHATPQGPGIPELVQPEGIVGGREHPVGITEPAENMEVDRKSHTSEEEQCTEGETGENVEREMENEKVNEAETKEEETGEAVDLSAAT